VKWDPAQVALDMEMLTSNGSYAFDNDECLSQSQIKSYFSRLALKQRSNEPDISRQPTINTLSVHLISPMKTSQINPFIMDTTYQLDSDEEQDERDLDIYTWRQVRDNALTALNTSTDCSSVTTTTTWSEIRDTTTTVLNTPAHSPLSLTTWSQVRDEGSASSSMTFSRVVLPVDTQLKRKATADGARRSKHTTN
jgi:hypothetical protein